MIHRAIFGRANFPRGTPWKFSAPAAGYHFHDLTGGEVNFVGIFSEGNNEWEEEHVFFFFVLVSVLDFSIAVRNASAAECPLRYSHARERALYRGVSNPDAPESRGKLKKKLDTARLLSSLLPFY